MFDINKLAERIAKNCKNLDGNAYFTALHIANLFGYCDAIIDNHLEDERDLFYILEDAGILGTKREDTMLPDGSQWTIHRWYLKPEKLIVQAEMPQKPEDAEENIYESVFQQIKDSKIGNANGN